MVCFVGCSLRCTARWLFIGLMWLCCDRHVLDGKAAAPAPAGPGLAGAGSGPGPIAADGSLLLYWIDAFEVPFDRSGKLYLFGTVHVCISRLSFRC